MTLRDTADQIIRASLRAVQPDAAVQRALQEFSCAGRVVLIAIGKAAWAMANAAWDTLSTRITSGAVITKYGHSRGPIGPLQIFEAGHPMPDEAGLRAAQAALELTRGHCGDQSHPQAAVRRQGRAVRAALPSGAGLLGRAVGYSRRPARHDRLRPCSAGQQHVRRGAGRRAEIRTAPV